MIKLPKVIQTYPKFLFTNGFNRRSKWYNQDWSRVRNVTCNRRYTIINKPKYK